MLRRIKQIQTDKRKGQSGSGILPLSFMCNTHSKTTNNQPTFKNTLQIQTPNIHSTTFQLYTPATFQIHNKNTLEKRQIPNTQKKKSNFPIDRLHLTGYVDPPTTAIQWPR